MFHWVTGMPFDSELHGGAYDDLTLWEQIDDGAQYTPAKKWLLSAPIMLCVCRPLLWWDFVFTVILGFSHRHITQTIIRGFLRLT
jgi:hypothetical protein